MKFKVSFAGAEDGFDALPDGFYTVENSGIEEKESKNGNPMISVTHTVIEADDDKYVGRKEWSNFILEHENEKVQSMNRTRLKQFMVAIGLMDKDDDLDTLEFEAEDVVGTQCKLIIKTTNGKDGNVYRNFSYR